MERKQNIDKNKFKVPEGYFDRLEKQVLENTVHAPKSQSNSMRVLRPWIGLAAGLAVMAVAFFVLYNRVISDALAEEQTTEQNYLAGLDEELFQSVFMVESESDDNTDKTLDDLADLLIELEEF